MLNRQTPTQRESGLPRTGAVTLPEAEILESFARDFGVRLIVLFGSRAKGKPMPTKDSDVDVAVLGCPKDRFWDCYQSLADVFGGYSLDLVELEKADPLFRYEILSDGILLYGDPDLFLEYRAYAYRDFVDSADLRALEDVLFRKKMAHLRQVLHDSA